MNKLEERQVNVSEEKKPYVKPDVIYQAPLEAMATDCQASPGKSGTCGTAYS